MGFFAHLVDLLSRLSELRPFIDVGWFDACSLATAFIYAMWKRHHATVRFRVFSRECAGHAADGISLFPLFMLFLGVISSKALNSLVHANRVILGMAAFFAICAIIEEDK